MTGDDDLRARLARIDPMRPGAADSLPSLTAAEIEERAMQTIETDTSSPQPDEPRAPWRRPRLLAAAAAAVLVLGAGAVFATSGDDPATKAGTPSTLALALPDTNAAASCAMFDVAILRGMPVAFAGTVTDISADTVTLDVDRWYKGGSAEQVAVTVASGQNSAALDGVDFVEGKAYLVAAEDGRVSGCGLSGPASPELESAYDQAFPG
jgi:hypothetical protein